MLYRYKTMRSKIEKIGECRCLNEQCDIYRRYEKWFSEGFQIVLKGEKTDPFEWSPSIERAKYKYRKAVKKAKHG
jgi:hypothetical protein